MAKRETKPGLSFYKLDTDRYLDRRVKQLKHSFGAVGMAIYDYLLCEIYRDKGCFIAWDENTAFDVSEYFGLKENTVKETVSYCATVGLFDLGVFRSENVLTSLSIQKRYIEVCVNAKRVNFEIPDNIKIVTELKDKPPDNKPKPPEENDNVIKGNVIESKEQEVKGIYLRLRDKIYKEKFSEFFKRNFGTYLTDWLYNHKEDRHIEPDVFEELDKKYNAHDFNNENHIRSTFKSVWEKVKKEKSFAKKEKAEQKEESLKKILQETKSATPWLKPE